MDQSLTQGPSKRDSQREHGEVYLVSASHNDPIQFGEAETAQSLNAGFVIKRS